MRDICWFRGTAGHLMKMRDCPSGCGTVDMYEGISNTTIFLLGKSLTWSQMSCRMAPICRETRHQWHRPAACRQATERPPPHDYRAVWRTSSWSLSEAPVVLASSTVACEVLSGDFETTPITTKTACQIGNNGCSTLFRTFEWKETGKLSKVANVEH